MLRALVIVLSIVLCLAVFDIIVLVGEILQALFLFILILFILLFMINDRVLTEYFLFVELGQVIAITILIILAIIGYIQIKKEK